MTITQGDLDGVHARVGRLETRVDDQQKALVKVSADIAWIKGFLQTQNGRGVKRDVGMVAGGGGMVGLVIWVLERLVL